VLATSEASNAISAERNRDGTAVEYLRALLRNTDSEADREMSIIDVCFEAGSGSPRLALPQEVNGGWEHGRERERE